MTDDGGTVLAPTGENLRRAAECIAEGGVVVAPSDTTLALTVDPWHADAIGRVYEMTGRPPEKPLTLFVRDPDDWQVYRQHDDPEFVQALRPRTARARPTTGWSTAARKTPRSRVQSSTSPANPTYSGTATSRWPTSTRSPTSCRSRRPSRYGSDEGNKLARSAQPKLGPV